MFVAAVFAFWFRLLIYKNSLTQVMSHLGVATFMCGFLDRRCSHIGIALVTFCFEHGLVENYLYIHGVVDSA